MAENENTLVIGEGMNLTPQSIYCGLAAEFNVTSQYSDIDVWITDTCVGTQLSVSGGKILIGERRKPY